MVGTVSAASRLMTRRRTLALAAGTAAAATGQRALSQSLTALRLASPPDDNTRAALYAIHAGIFKKYGLDVALQRMNSGAATAAAVASGAVDIGKTSLVALLQAHERGIPFLMIAGSGLFETAKPTSGFIVAKSGPIGTIAELAGKTISVPSLGSIDQVAIAAWVQHAGGDPSTLKFVELPTAAALAAIENGRIDGANVQTPVLGDAEQSGKVRVLGYPFSVIADRFLLSAWFASAAYAAHNGPTIHRFIGALREATAYVTANPAATGPLLAAYSGIPEAVIDRMQRQPLTVQLDPQEIEPVLDIAVKYKLLKQRFPVASLLLPS